MASLVRIDRKNSLFVPLFPHSQFCSAFQMLFVCVHLSTIDLHCAFAYISQMQLQLVFIQESASSSIPDRMPPRHFECIKIL